jgi:hypothetical protein
MVPLSTTQRIIFSILLTVFSNGPVKASDIKIETAIDTAKLIGLSRPKAQEMLGQPQRSEEFFPYSTHCTIVDYFEVKGNKDVYVRVTYGKDAAVSMAGVESSPHTIPKFMGEEIDSINLTDTKLRDFLKSLPEEKLRNMSAEQIMEKLGKPDRSWHEKSKAGGLDWHFLNLLYYLSKNGRRAFIVRFNEASNSVYEYRLQSISE